MDDGYKDYKRQTTKVTHPAHGRLHSLDGLRGIAALIVVFSHLVDTTPLYYTLYLPHSIAGFIEQPLTLLKYFPFRLFISGRAMVMLFFVLSGFVLCYSYKPREGYTSYLAKRFCRIYPPFFVAILLSAALYVLSNPKPMSNMSYWVNDLNWNTPLSIPFLASNLLMTGVPEWPSLNNPTWSLIHELRISVFFPALLLLLRWNFKAAVIGTAIIGFAILYRESQNPIILTMQLTLGYSTFFILGAAVATKLDAILLSVRKLPVYVRAALWSAAFVLLLAPMNHAHDSFAPGLGAVLVIPLVLTSPIAVVFLESLAVQWLGRISYSLYLIHVPLILTLIHAFGYTLPLSVICIAAVFASLAFAQVFYTTIERPSIWLGRTLVRRWSTRPQA